MENQQGQAWQEFHEASLKSEVRNHPRVWLENLLIRDLNKVCE